MVYIFCVLRYYGTYCVYAELLWYILHCTEVLMVYCLLYCTPSYYHKLFDILYTKII